MQNSALGQEPPEKLNLDSPLKSEKGLLRSHSKKHNTRIMMNFHPFSLILLILAWHCNDIGYFHVPNLLRLHQLKSTRDISEYIFFLKRKQLLFPRECFRRQGVHKGQRIRVLMRSFYQLQHHLRPRFIFR